MTHKATQFGIAITFHDGQSKEIWRSKAERDVLYKRIVKTRDEWFEILSSIEAELPPNYPVSVKKIRK